LFIDEADTFLRCRTGARHSWEASQTNELLKRLELAKGVVILATNVMAATDQAVLRRLDVKAKFDLALCSDG
jgi:SpoVK/Ycf46/Vps4 family AAA+-type ATPase